VAAKAQDSVVKDMTKFTKRLENGIRQNVTMGIINDVARQASLNAAKPHHIRGVLLQKAYMKAKKAAINAHHRKVSIREPAYTTAKQMINKRS